MPRLLWSCKHFFLCPENMPGKHHIPREWWNRNEHILIIATILLYCLSLLLSAFIHRLKLLYLTV